MLLDPSSPEVGNPTDIDDANYVYAVDTTTGAIFVTSDRLRQALFGSGAIVNAISYGFDAHDLAFPHGKLIYSLSSTSNLGPEVAPWHDASGESQIDYEADLYYVNNYPMRNKPSGSSKVAEENSANLPRRGNALLFSEKLYLTGGSTGVTLGAPSKLRGLDLHTHSRVNDIYFSVDQEFTATSGTYYSSDILKLDRFGAISLYFRGELHGLVRTDNIDALSLDIDHSNAINQDQNGIFSLAPLSPSVQSGVYAAADLIQVIKRPSGDEIELFRDRYSTTGPGEGDIGSVVSIDPAEDITGLELTLNGSDLSLTIPGDIAAVRVYLGRRAIGVFTSSDTITISSLGLQPGDIVRFDIQGMYEGIPFEVPKIIEVPPTLAAEPKGTIKSQQLGLDALKWVLAIEPLPGVDSWQILLNGEVHGTVATVPATYVTPNLDPGAYRLAVHPTTLFGGVVDDRGVGLYANGFVQRAAPDRVTPPEITSVAPSSQDPNRVVIEWSFPTAGTANPVTIEIDHPTTPISQIATSPFTTPLWDYGYYQGRLVASNGTALSQSVTFDFHIAPPARGFLIRDPFDSGQELVGVTVDPTDGRVVVLRQIGSTNQRDIQRINASALVSVDAPTAAPDNALAIAYHDSELWYAIQGPSNTISIQSETSTSSIQVVLDGSPVHGHIHDMATLGEDRLQILAGNDRLIVRSTNGVVEGALSANGAFTISPAGNNMYETISLPIDSYVITSYDNTDRVVDTIALDHDLGAFPKAAHFTTLANTGLPTCYVVSGSSLYEFVTRRIPVDSGGHAVGRLYGSSAPASVLAGDPQQGWFGPGLVGIGVSEVGLYSDLNVKLAAEFEDWQNVLVYLQDPAGQLIPLLLRPLLPSGEQTLVIDDPNDGFRPGQMNAPLDSLAWNNTWGVWRIAVFNFGAQAGTIQSVELSFALDADPEFIRGNVNFDSVVNDDDLILLAAHLGDPVQNPIYCMDAADVNDDGSVNSADVTMLQGLLDTDTAPTTCATDATPDSLECDATFACP